MSTFQYVKPSRRCPLCSGDTDCRINPNGGVHCLRTTRSNPPTGWRYVKDDKLGFGIYHRDDSDSDHSTSNTRTYRNPPADSRIDDRPKKKKRSDKNANIAANEFSSTVFQRIHRDKRPMTDAECAWLANHLTLPNSHAFFKLLNVEFLPSDDRNRSAFVFPECDENGTVISYLLRYPDKTKRNHKVDPNDDAPGRGLSLTDGWRTNAILQGNGFGSPIFLCEGPTDTLALLAMGLNAVGRPSNTAGVDFLIPLLRFVPHSQPIVVLGENDLKPDGQFPGRDGAERTAEKLRTALDRQIFVVMPPTGIKDVRTMIEESREAIKAKAMTLADLGRSLLIHTADNQYPAPITPTREEAFAAVNEAVIANNPPIAPEHTAASTPPPFTTSEGYVNTIFRPCLVCSRRQVILLARGLESADIEPDCRSWDCPECYPVKKRQQADTVCHHLFRHGGPMYQFKVPGGPRDQAWKSTSKQMEDRWKYAPIPRHAKCFQDDDGKDYATWTTDLGATVKYELSSPHYYLSGQRVIASKKHTAREIASFRCGGGDDMVRRRELAPVDLATAQAQRPAGFSSVPVLAVVRQAKVHLYRAGISHIAVEKDGYMLVVAERVPSSSFVTDVTGPIPNEEAIAILLSEVEAQACPGLRGRLLYTSHNWPVLDDPKPAKKAGWTRIGPAKEARPRDVINILSHHKVNVNEHTFRGQYFSQTMRRWRSPDEEHQNMIFRDIQSATVLGTLDFDKLWGTEPTQGNPVGSGPPSRGGGGGCGGVDLDIEFPTST